jgi:hypothetical protein
MQRIYLTASNFREKILRSLELAAMLKVMKQQV